MPQISDVQKLGAKFLIFGAFGTGKSYFSSTLPQPIFWFDTDRGMRTIFNRLRNSGDIESAKIEYETYWDEPYMKRKQYKMISTKESILSQVNPSPEAYLDLEDKLSEIIVSAQQGTCQYKTVVFDSLTTLAIIFTKYIMQVNIKQGRIFALPNQSDMGNFIRKLPELLGMIHMLSDYGIHTVVTAHMQQKENIRGIIKDPKDPSTDQREYMGTWRLPSIIGKDLPFSVGCYFDEVYHSFTERSGSAVDYYFETRSDKDLFCKSRAANMPTKISQNWSKISKYIGSGLEEESK